MNTVEIKGLTGCFPERIEGTDKWYFAQECREPFCDLYEAEEIAASGREFCGMNCHLIEFPGGRVYSPFDTEQNIYIDAPVYHQGNFYFLKTDFSRRIAGIYSYAPSDSKPALIDEISLDDIEDCYNLRLTVWPVTLTRDDNTGVLQIIWPEQTDIELEENETLMFRDGGSLYLSQWCEEPYYHELLTVRDIASGEITEKSKGSLYRMPEGVYWRL